MGGFPYSVLCTKDVSLVVVTLQLRQLVLLEKWNEVALILSQSEVCQELGHTLEF